MAMPFTNFEETLAAGGAETEEGFRPTIVSAPPAASPELTDRPRRRTFTAADKLRILGAVDSAAPGGDKGGRSTRRRGSQLDKLTIGSTELVRAKVPACSRHKGYEDIVVQDLSLHPQVTRYRRERLRNAGRPHDPRRPRSRHCRAMAQPASRRNDASLCRANDLRADRSFLTGMSVGFRRDRSFAC